MTTSVKNLLTSKYLENAQTTQYTALSVKAVIDKFTVTNVSAFNVSLSVNLVKNAVAVTDENLIINAHLIEPGETYLCSEMVGHVLESGDFISTLASAASALVANISGREIT